MFRLRVVNPLGFPRNRFDFDTLNIQPSDLMRKTNTEKKLTRISFASVLQNSASQSSSSEIDEGPAAKLARFTSELIAENNQRKTITNQTKKKQYEKPSANQSDDEVSISPRRRSPSKFGANFNSNFIFFVAGRALLSNVFWWKTNRFAGKRIWCRFRRKRLWDCAKRKRN